MSLLAVDLGTSGIRVGAFADTGAALAQLSVRTRLSRPEPGVVEADAEGALTQTVRLLSEIGAHPALREDPPQALSFCLQGETCVPVDRDGVALAPAVLSMDRRGDDSLTRLVDGFGAAELQRLTGQPPHPMFAVYKIATLLPAWRAAGVHQVRSLGEMITTRLGARPAIDTTLAARTGALDVERETWSRAILDAADIPLGLLPEVVRPGTGIGGLGGEAAAATGLPHGLPIVVASHDQAASYWGAGGAIGAASVLSLGSSDCLTVGTHSRPEGLEGTGIATYPGPDGTWLTLAGTAASGWALEWFAGVAGIGSPEEFAALFASLPAEPPALVVLPYLAGSGTLDNDAGATGAIIGLTLSTTPGELARAFVESIGFELREVASAFEARGITVGDLHAVGGGARTGSTLAICAQALGRGVSAAVDAGALRGAALQGGVGAGVFGSLTDLPSPALAEPVRPDPEHAPWYDGQARRYRDLYVATAPLNPAGPASAAEPPPAQSP